GVSGAGAAAISVLMIRVSDAAQLRRRVHAVMRAGLHDGPHDPFLRRLGRRELADEAAFVHHVDAIAQLAEEGRSILLISSEMPELLGLCDRLYVMNEGEFVAEFDAAEASQQKIMHAIVNAGQHELSA
ncbi:MAG TPA: hypothetical protein VIO33_15315, partial [Burkholderiaceae bacterium]